jgi:hypothetical protein
MGCNGIYPLAISQSAIEHGPYIVDLPISNNLNMMIFYRYVSLPNGISSNLI